MDVNLTLVVIAIITALCFDFLNGFHDAANSIATIVSTHVMKPQYAVVWAAFFNFIAFAFFGLSVAATIGVGLIDPAIINEKFILAALLGAISWNLFTWYYGLPSSSSHALIGGLIGTCIAKAGLAPLKWGGISKVLIAIILSPLLGMVIGLLMMFIVVRVCFYATPHKVDYWFRKLQFVSSAFISLGHGGNDAQKTMGIIAVLLSTAHFTSGKFHVPLAVIIACNFVIALGTYFGGWRIVKTMGMKITKLKPVSGFCAETAAAMTLFLATALGIPVSTTHTITGAIVGVGSLSRVSAVRWGMARNIVWAWFLTVPAAGLVSAGLWGVISYLPG